MIDFQRVMPDILKVISGGVEIIDEVVIYRRIVFIEDAGEVTGNSGEAVLRDDVVLERLARIARSGSGYSSQRVDLPRGQSAQRRGIKNLSYAEASSERIEPIYLLVREQPAEVAIPHLRLRHAA